MDEFRNLALGQLVESKTNPRRAFDGDAQRELTESIKAKGVLVPLLVRSVNGRFDILCGARRFRSAKAAGLTEVPARVVVLSDQEALEIQIIDNLQRQDLHPLEEAHGYQQLLATGYEIARIAERVGRSVKYIYDRVKLLSLTKAAQEAFLKGQMTAGHAILLARLTPAEQKRAMEREGGGLFTGERLLWDPDEQGHPEEAIKPVSVREFGGWIDQHVKFDRAAADPMLFPETVTILTKATEAAEKVVQITYEHYVQPEARDGKERIYGPRSWKRVTGKKVCPKAVTGVIVAGPGRGDAFKVCIDKKGCKVHWAAEQRESKQRARAVGQGGKTGKDFYERQRQRDEEEQQRKQAIRARWKKAEPAILTALAGAVKKASARAGALLASIILERCDEDYGVPKDAAKYVPIGTTAEDFVRHAAFKLLANDLREYSAPEDFPKRAKAFGLDVKKIVDEVAPVPKPEKPALQSSARGKAKKKAVKP